MCAGRTTTLQTWLLELSYNVFQSCLSCFKLDRNKIKVMGRIKEEFRRFVVFSTPISCERLNVSNCQPRRGKVREALSKLLGGRVGAIENAIAPFRLNMKVC